MHLPAYFRQMFLALVEDLIKSLKLNISLPRLRWTWGKARAMIGEFVYSSQIFLKMYKMTSWKYFLETKSQFLEYILTFCVGPVTWWPKFWLVAGPRLLNEPITNQFHLQTQNVHTKCWMFRFPSLLLWHFGNIQLSGECGLFHESHSS